MVGEIDLAKGTLPYQLPQGIVPDALEVLVREFTADRRLATKENWMGLGYTGLTLGVPGRSWQAIVGEGD